MNQKDMIRAEIERRFWSFGTPLHDDEVTKKVDEILDIIENTLSEESDKSLEEAAGEQAKSFGYMSQDVEFKENVESFKAGAEWQKEQMTKEEQI